MPFLQEILARPRSLQEESTLRALVNTAVSVNHFSDDEPVFCLGELSHASYFASHDFVYLQNGLGALKPDGWVSQMCLWTAWTHVGDLVCRNFNKTIQISAEDAS